MRQFFKLMAIVALALLVATPAMALDFKFGAEYRVRFYDMVNQGIERRPRDESRRCPAPHPPAL